MEQKETTTFLKRMIKFRLGIKISIIKVGVRSSLMKKVKKPLTTKALISKPMMVMNSTRT